ncbi:hypothetical protein OESDEN_13982, partial [Oesophagostomum dentatum]
LYPLGGKQEIVLKVNHTLFRVADEGKLVVAEKLNGYAGERLCSTIIAKDAGEPPRTTTYPFCVTVYPASNSHFSPLIVFPKQNSIHYFDENVQYDELLRIKLLEEEHMGVVSYKFDETFKKKRMQIFQDWENFSLNTSGSLSAKEPFDFEKKPVHELKILACRQANCSSVHVFISVNDRNDNCPIFPRQTFLEQKFQVTAYDCHMACRDPHKSSNGTIIGILTVKDVNDNFPKFSEKTYYATVIQSYPLSESPISIDAKTGEITASEPLRESSYSFTVTVIDGANHDDSAGVMISVVTYSQQTELLFDAPFEFIVRNEKNIVKLLSNATSLTAMIDRCRQNLNYTVVLAHFLDDDGSFVEVDTALRRLVLSNSTARRELRNAYGLREKLPLTVSGVMALETVILAVLDRRLLSS